MVKDYNEIKNNIKDSGKLIYWLNEKGTILLVNNKKSQAKIELKKMKHISGLLYRFNLSFHTGYKPGQGGPIAINIRTFEKTNSTITKVPGYKNGIIWISKDYIELRGWQEKYINFVYNIINKKNFQFKIGIYILDELL